MDADTQAQAQRTNPPNIIAGRDLYKHFQLGEQQVKALDGVSLDIPQGQFVVIMGASGSGKSTLLYALTGLDTPTQGQVYVAGNRLDLMGQKELAQMRSQLIGFVFQGFYLIPTMTALENVMLSGIFAGHSREVRERRASYLLHILKLGDRMDHRPNQLSGGQQQRVAIARALYANPPIIVADEPTGALDSKTGTSIMRMLQHLSKKQGKTILIVTHDPAITQYADRVIRLKDGHITEDTLRREVI